MKTTGILILVLAGYLHPLNAGNPQDIVGKWITPENKSIIQIEYIVGKYTGKIFMINPEIYVNGSPPNDVLNMDPGLRSRSLEGIIILSGISYDKTKERWNIKQIYEPERGKYFEGYITMNSRDELRMRGYMPGKKWLGKTEIWNRVEGNEFFKMTSYE